MRISLVMAQRGTGGTERQVQLLAERLSAAGCQVRVVSLFGDDIPAKQRWAEGAPVTNAGMSRSPLRTVHTAVAVFRLLQQFRAERPDVVHAFLCEAAYVLVPVLAARPAKVRLVVSGRQSLGAFKGRRRWVWFVERLARRFSHAFNANAEAVRDDAIRSEGLAADKVFVIENALADEAFDVSSRGATTGPLGVPSVANLYKYKGHDDLLDSVAPDVGDAVDVTVTRVGEGPRRERDDAPLLRDAGAFVLASWHEGMSNALLEGAAAGLALVATGVGGTPEVVGGNGLPCPPRDPASLACAIGELSADPALRASLGERARKRALERYAVSRFVADHVRPYASLLEGSCAE
jgi:L-malate glycosyltransferase